MKEKILHVTSVHQHDDIRIFHKECCTLSTKYDVTILNPVFNGSINGIKFETINLPKNRFLRIVFGWIFCLKKTLFTDYKIIHFHDPELLLCVLFWKVRGYKTIYDIHEDNIIKLHVIHSFNKSNYFNIHNLYYIVYYTDKIVSTSFLALNSKKFLNISSVF